ncbi:transcription termination factor Rho [Actinocorallia sp. A-T 12471]|uniref:transcription termination factor Rho n=1 Tax=Actinocorallia sp. A-T 12471 TaxID=3089813 RepID=UPI0029D2E280|nr:transcription termination factor Rho [Actinocorallia sp. A-T 12471]MDX6741863.1 transcription termination factor Rho [Actinocorallia sp. A-T 12471]
MTLTEETTVRSTVPVSGILSVTGKNAHLRTRGLAPSPDDVQVPLALVAKYRLRSGDQVTGAARPRTRGGPAVLATVDGRPRERVPFEDQTPYFPTERLTLGPSPAGRIIDLLAPIGKGQRGLIVAPPKAGKTIILQTLANAIAANHPECELIVLLVDERPEEVTDLRRKVPSAQIVASTFDRPAGEHIELAELAVERAKRLAERGRDVVLLLDSLTRLGRAHNIAAPASSRILAGGVAAGALYPPKKFFGAARSLEQGGSLTILATALVETGSRMDEVFFEEFKGTGNMELRLSRRLADRRIFPAIDIAASGTRRDELLLPPAELAASWKLRRTLAAQDEQQAMTLLLDKIKKTRSNAEFLAQLP